MQRVNMDLPAELWRRVSVRAAELGTEKRQIVAEALETYLAAQDPVTTVNRLHARRRDRGALTAQEQKYPAGTEVYFVE